MEGFSPVPEGPGLGYEVDEVAIKRLAANKPDDIPRCVPVIHLPGGHKVYGSGNLQQTGREEGVIRGISFERWEDDGSPEFQQTYERVENDGSFTV